jgi:hypothetical protein
MSGQDCIFFRALLKLYLLTPIKSQEKNEQEKESRCEEAPQESKKNKGKDKSSTLPGRQTETSSGIRIY